MQLLPTHLLSRAFFCIIVFFWWKIRHLENLTYTNIEKIQTFLKKLFEKRPLHLI